VKRLVLVVAIALMTPIMFATAASAHSMQESASCTSATFTYAHFSDSGTRTVNETVAIDGTQVAAQPFTFEGSTGTDTIAITVPVGTHTVSTHTDWHPTSDTTRSIDRKKYVSGCGTALCPPTTISADFNQVAIPDHRSIWFNSSFTVLGGAASPMTIATHGGQVTFSDGVTDYTVPIPDATITFSPSAASATTEYIGHHWSTVVPAGFSDNVFLSGASFPVPAGGLPASISPVTWTTNIQTDTPGVMIEWRWAAVVLGGVTSHYNKLGVKPLHSATLDAYPNGDEAGTAEHALFSDAGARGFGDGDNHGGNTDSVACAGTSS
jgi:hypothetical protein